MQIGTAKVCSERQLEIGQQQKEKFAAQLILNSGVLRRITWAPSENVSNLIFILFQSDFPALCFRSFCDPKESGYFA